MCVCAGSTSDLQTVNSSNCTTGPALEQTGHTGGCDVTLNLEEEDDIARTNQTTILKFCTDSSADR